METEAEVRRDAQTGCGICHGSGWHWGWDRYREPVMLRCSCVDRRRELNKAVARGVLTEQDSK